MGPGLDLGGVLRVVLFEQRRGSPAGVRIVIASYGGDLIFTTGSATGWLVQDIALVVVVGWRG